MTTVDGKVRGGGKGGREDKMEGEGGGEGVGGRGKGEVREGR